MLQNQNQINAIIQTGKSAITGFLNSIYVLITVPALLVTYKLFRILQEKQILADFIAIVKAQRDAIIYIADNCFEDILNISRLFSCIMQ
jgi:hypothetical protein